MKSHVLRLVGGTRSQTAGAERCSASSDEQLFRYPANAEEVSEVSCYPERRQARRENTAVRGERRAS
jgi:hypothetical protein